MNEPAPFTKNQIDYFNRCFRSWFNAAEGGKRGGKNVLQTMAFCTCLDEHPNRLHLIAGVSTATARLNILDCDGYGLLNYFEGRCRSGKYQNRDCLYINALRGGQKIVLISGGGKNGDEKLIKGNSYGMAYVTEANECSPVFLKEVFDRTISSKNRKIFHDFNPKADGHWYYTDILGLHERNQSENSDYGYNYGHFTIADNMSISNERLKQIIGTYDKKSVWYQRDILGKRKQAEGLVYPMFSYDCHVVPTIPRPYSEYYISNDYGVNHPCVFLLFGLHDGVWYQIKEYYHNGDGENKKQKTVTEYYRDLLDFIGKLPLKAINWFYMDNAPVASSFNVHLKQQRPFRTKLADNDVLSGIQEVATALTADKLKINDCCKNTIREFGIYQWKENSTKDEPLMENDDCLSCVRYFVKTKKIVSRLK